MQTTDKKELTKKITEGDEFEYQGFIRGIFSNYYYAPFEVDGKIYWTAEHYVQASKARLFADENIERFIMLTVAANVAHTYGQQVKNFNEEIWQENRHEIMLEALRYKFIGLEPLKQSLLNTHDDVLVNMNEADLYWGAGLSPQDNRLGEPFEWPGENVLGFMLMQVREELKDLK